MKIKIFENALCLEEEVNEFIKNKKVIDIKITSYGYVHLDDSAYSKITVLVLYEDAKK